MLALMPSIGLTIGPTQATRSKTLTVSEYQIQAEIADTPALRRRGLMERVALAEDAGMLFVFAQPNRQHCFWMRDTYIPLDVAFLDASGRILQISSMEPLSERTHCSRQAAAYALEVSRNWFSHKGIGVGDQIQGVTGLTAER